MDYLVLRPLLLIVVVGPLIWALLVTVGHTHRGLLSPASASMQNLGKKREEALLPAAFRCLRWPTFGMRSKTGGDCGEEER